MRGGRQTLASRAPRRGLQPPLEQHGRARDAQRRRAHGIGREATVIVNMMTGSTDTVNYDSKRSDPPMASWPRFDLTDSSYAMGLMAQTTPAWREPYVEVLDQLIERHTGWWSANDWLTQFGHDPDRADYPDVYRLLIPTELWGNYDVPGWTANGVVPQPPASQRQPITASEGRQLSVIHVLPTE